ncbi:MAG: bifunctional helix-turn-helix transcriptional regulator/GNAT family N-acetyltransferase [Ilumatobacter sp.]|uniref:bifunctional helix-turn-helix transcriptional regulator/GNAT family N-acetyltransferase n=1 Tax=Ilumatobacter sp. TaxID=1967498 RepID=UPI002639F33D|nr:bifunctional helix-turn-helix transcriptional regulator/GNAT family N-acetyltransferase [Ilumatobacter sp.]MDJ0767192.1 bifunctional helix-turn-helix transcriptional regulator/GNAT family N-acetyltransferase [Ilumatobacter sp.]
MDAVETLRRFNRSYTQRIGVLEASYLGTGRALGPSRVLFEIGTGGARVADLRRRLGLDSGYLSRLLRGLEGEGLVAVERDADDGRQRIARLTGAGRRVWARLDDRSDRKARRMIEPLSERQRADLADALARAERLLRAASVEFVVADPRGHDARRALASYFAELDARFDDGFDQGAGGTASDAAEMSPPNGAFVLAFEQGIAVGCGGLQRIDEHTAEIKRMWIDPAWRGLGLGPRLLERLEIEARVRGHRRTVLDTNEVLLEAVAMYERAGYHRIGRYNDNPYAHHWFTKDLDGGPS